MRSGIGDVEGVVSVGMPGSLSSTLVGPFIERCRAAYPKITLRITDADSDSLRDEVEKGRLDLALPFEDEFFPRRASGAAVPAESLPDQQQG